MLAAKISDQIEPSIARLKDAVSTQRRFRVSNSGINEDGDMLGAVGLRCEEEPTMQRPALAFGVVITQFKASEPKAVCGSVTWSVPAVRGRQDGFIAYEAKTEPLGFSGERLPGEFISMLPRLEASFLRALHRGRPPGRILARWLSLIHGIPMPQILRIPREPNKAPEPTPGSVTLRASSRVNRFEADEC